MNPEKITIEITRECAEYIKAMYDRLSPRDLASPLIGRRGPHTLQQGIKEHEALREIVRQVRLTAPGVYDATGWYTAPKRYSDSTNSTTIIQVDMPEGESKYGPK